MIENIAACSAYESLSDLCDYIKQSVKHAASNHHDDLAMMRLRENRAKENTQRDLNFHSVQVACDLFTLGIVELTDGGAKCPLAIGSEGGIAHVKRWEDPRATLTSLSEQLRREPHEVQTSLCEYNRYVKWWNGVENHKPRKTALAASNAHVAMGVRAAEVRRAGSPPESAMEEFAFAGS